MIITETGIHLTNKEYKDLLERLRTALEKNRQYEALILHKAE